jgi:hypothetical protein
VRRLKGKNMMYKKNVVACVKVGGKILREQSDRVILPFGSEYSILLKNLDSVRVQAKVSIDGQDATEGTWLIIEANSSLELERFIRNGNLDKGNRFKFIERTKPIEDARGIKADDGLVRIEYKKEYIAPPVVTQTNIVRTKYIYDYDYWYPYYLPYRPYYDGITYTSCNASQSSGSLMRSASVNTMSATMDFAAQKVDAGITVPGSESNQQFQNGSGFATESQSEVIILHLVGTNQKSQSVKKAVTVSDKPKCVTCHKVNKGGSKFCSQCGTALEII